VIVFLGFLLTELLPCNVKAYGNQSQKLKKKGKGAHEPKIQTAGAYPGFLSVKHA